MGLISRVSSRTYRDAMNPDFKNLPPPVFSFQTPTSSSPFSCSICGKSFKTKYDKERHHLTHTKEQPHQCKICNYSTNQSSNLTRHYRNQHRHFNSYAEERSLFENRAFFAQDGVQSFAFSCRICQNFVTPNKEKLKEHLIKFHDDLRGFICPRCHTFYPEITEFISCCSTGFTNKQNNKITNSNFVENSKKSSNQSKTGKSSSCFTCVY